MIYSSEKLLGVTRAIIDYLGVEPGPCVTEGLAVGLLMFPVG